MNMRVIMKTKYYLYTEWICADRVFIDAETADTFYFGSCHDWLQNKI